MILRRRFTYPGSQGSGSIFSAMLRKSPPLNPRLPGFLPYIGHADNGEQDKNCFPFVVPPIIRQNRFRWFLSAGWFLWWLCPHAPGLIQRTENCIIVRIVASGQLDPKSDGLYKINCGRTSAVWACPACLPICGMVSNCQGRRSRPF